MLSATDVNFSSDSSRTNLSSVHLEPTEIATYIGAAVMILFLILGLIGNILIIVAIVSNRRVWSVINTFIVSLALNDLLTYLLVVVYIISSYVTHAWNAGEVICALNPELTVLFTGCSLWHTALIAIHRYVVVCHNAVYSRMSKQTYVVFVLIMARAIPMACVFPGFSLHTSGYAPRMLRCILLPSQSTRIGIATLLLIILPCIIVVICFAFVFGFVWKIGRQVQTRNTMLKREVQITKMFGMVFFMILLGFIPYAVIRNVDNDNSLHADFYVVVTVVYAIACCSNPLVYGAMSTEIRGACACTLRRLLECLHADACCKCAQVRMRGYIPGESCTFSAPSRIPQPCQTGAGSSDASSRATCQKHTFRAVSHDKRIVVEPVTKNWPELELNDSVHPLPQPYSASDDCVQNGTAKHATDLDYKHITVPSDNASLPNHSQNKNLESSKQVIESQDNPLTVSELSKPEFNNGGLEIQHCPMDNPVRQKNDILQNDDTAPDSRPGSSSTGSRMPNGSDVTPANCDVTPVMCESEKGKSELIISCVHETDNYSLSDATTDVIL